MEKKNTRENDRMVTVNNVDFMRKIRENVFLRLDGNELTLRKLSFKSGISYETLRTFLYGNSRDIFLSNVVGISKALGVTIDELIGCETAPGSVEEIVKMCRKMPENDLYLAHWFVRYLSITGCGNKAHRRFIRVMIPTADNDGNLKISLNYRELEVSDLEESVRNKIFFGISIECDNYMPHYAPFDIALICNNRPPRFTEDCLIRIGRFLYIAKRKTNGKTSMYYSIRDGKLRFREDEIDELIGYITAVK